MPRSLRVKKDQIKTVKSALLRNGYPRQKDLAEELQISLSTVGNFLNGRPVDNLNFREICHALGLDAQEMAYLEEKSSDTSSVAKELESNLAITDPYLDEEEELIYVERPILESLCHETLSQPGSLIRIKAPSLMGKTSLIRKIIAQAVKQNYRTAYVNLHLTEKKDFTNLDQFLKWFCVSVGQGLGLPNKLADYWDEQFSPSKMNCTEYFEKYLLAQAKNPLVLCLDEVERIFPHQEVASDFFGLLRAWHEQGKIRNIWKKLRLVVAHSTEVYIPLHINQSPFNVGVPIELTEFTEKQVQDLAVRHGLNLANAEVQKLMEMVGGHPYLLEQAFFNLKIDKHLSLEQLLQTAATEAGIYSSHLRRLLRVIQEHSELAEAFKKVVNDNSPVLLEPMQTYQLHSMGLVDLLGNEVVVRCNLYRQYFSDRLGINKITSDLDIVQYFKVPQDWGI